MVLVASWCWSRTWLLVTFSCRFASGSAHKAPTYEHFPIQFFVHPQLTSSSSAFAARGRRIQKAGADTAILKGEDPGEERKCSYIP